MSARADRTLSRRCHGSHGARNPSRVARYAVSARGGTVHSHDFDAPAAGYIFHAVSPNVLRWRRADRLTAQRFAYNPFDSTPDAWSRMTLRHAPHAGSLLAVAPYSATLAMGRRLPVRKKTAIRKKTRICDVLCVADASRYRAAKAWQRRPEEAKLKTKDLSHVA
jgi:hypothetical protein